MKQNILIIMSDQHSPAALGACGNGRVRTPNLDRLASSGILFSNCYCNSPICGPSRWSFMTGQYAHDHGGYDNGSTLSSEEPTFAHMVTLAGYETVICSRMHFQGVDQYHGYEKRLATEHNNPIDYPPDAMRLDAPLDPPWKGFCSDLPEQYERGTSPMLVHDDYVLDKACSYLRSREWGRRPFLLTASFLAPHPSVRRRPEYEDLYRQYLSEDLGAGELSEAEVARFHPHIRRQYGFHGNETGLGDTHSKASNHCLMAEYYSRITYFDSQIGRLLSTLEESGEWDNTVVVYLSDHGDDMGRHGYWGKTNFYESVVKVPLIIRVPGCPSKQVEHRSVSLVDLFPTFCDVAGQSISYTIPGDSLLPLVHGQETQWNKPVFSEYFGHYARRAMFMVRKDNSKFNYYVDERPELYDLDHDPDETCNLAADPSYSNLCREMEEILRAVCDPEEVNDRVALNQKKRQLIADATSSSIQTKARIRDYIKQYHEEWDELMWKGHTDQERFETHLE